MAQKEETNELKPRNLSIHRDGLIFDILREVVSSSILTVNRKYLTKSYVDGNVFEA